MWHIFITTAVVAKEFDPECFSQSKRRNAAAAVDHSEQANLQEKISYSTHKIASGINMIKICDLVWEKDAQSNFAL